MAETEERYFLNPESVSEHLFCSICQEVFVEPHRAPCGHSFCKRCIVPWLRQSRTCPEDRRNLKEKDLHRDFILENIIGDQMVACPFRRKGCDYIGQLGNLKSHKKSCCFNPENLPDFLREEAMNSSLTSDESCNMGDDEALPTPNKPSLKMRLFSAGGGQRELLQSMFDKENNQTNS